MRPGYATQNLSNADLARPGIGTDGLNCLLRNRIRYGHLSLDLRSQVDYVLAPSVNPDVAFLASGHASLQHRDVENTKLQQWMFQYVQLQRFKDSFNRMHPD
jgi:hypothetical protein